MAKVVATSFEKAVSQEYDRLLHTVAQGAATEIGNLPDSVIPSRDDEQARWDFRHPDATPEVLQQAADEIATRLAQQFQEQGQPMPDPEAFTRLIAAQVSRVHTGGMRREVLSRGTPMPKDQVAKAQGFLKRDERQPEQQQPIESMAPEMPAAVQRLAEGVV